MLDAMPEVEKTSVFGTAVHAVVRAPATGGRGASLQRAARGAASTVAPIAPVQPSLEDVFLDVVGSGRA